MFKKISPQLFLDQQQLAFSLLASRSLLYFLEALPLPFIRRAMDPEFREATGPNREFLRAALKRIVTLLKQDSKNIAEGIYPAPVLGPVSPREHAFRYLKILADAFVVADRRFRRKNQDFSAAASAEAADMPDYYKRNFHFQTDGYFSDESADIYDHQVELLFLGCADAMRRMLLAPIKRHLHGSQGEGCKFLELGAGRGSATKFVAQTFAQSEVVAIDLSLNYLNRARKELARFRRVSLLKGDASNLDFKDATFDVVYSVFMMHELPDKIRQQVLAEAVRVLKPGGIFAVVDSLQAGDDLELDLILNEFPKFFHEPFYKNYLQSPLETEFHRLKFNGITGANGFLSKVIWGVKT